MDYKQAILIRSDLKMGKGKIASQASHASVAAAFKLFKKDERLFNEWFPSMAKIVLKVSSEKELLEYANKAKVSRIVFDIVRDAGRTQVEPGTITALAIGPDEEPKIDTITKGLKLL